MYTCTLSESYKVWQNKDHAKRRQNLVLEFVQEDTNLQYIIL